MSIPTGTIELKKYSFRQTREGTFIGFVIHPNNIPHWLTADPIGTVYAAALVQVNEDGQPISEVTMSTPEPAPSPDTLEKSGGGANQQPKGGGDSNETSRTNDGRSQSRDKSQPSPDAASGGGKTRRWDEITYREQACIRCADDAFITFLGENYREHFDDSADVVRDLCGVTSRSEIVRGTPAGDRWHDLDIQFSNYLRGETP
jgi:hypothetical protein